jgi:Domain of unknown function (DUF4349)
MKNTLYILLAIFSLSSCASELSRTKYSSPSTSSFYWTSNESSNELDAMDTDDRFMEITTDINGNNIQVNARSDRKILYSGNMHLLVKNIDTTIAQVKHIAKIMNGYVSESGTYSTTIFVPADQLNAAMKNLRELGSVQTYSIESDDVTENYLDIGIRLENAKKARNRYLELLAKAENVEAALKVEKELERLNGEIDSMEGKLKFWDHRMEYSPITVRYTAKKKLGILGWVGFGLYQTVKWLFVRS